MTRRLVYALGAAALTGLAACNAVFNLNGPDPGEPEYVPQTFVNWETPHVSPLAVSADGSRLFAVNMPAARLDVFTVSSNGLRVDGAVSVGLDPVTVRVRTADEVWVVNHISDSVSIVDLASRNVVRTLAVGDEPTDVGFAAGRAFVVCSQANRLDVFDLANLDAPPQIVPLAGEDPRALTVSADGRHIYVTIFESGNRTTLVPFDDVSDTNGPYEGWNPPPNTGAGFVPENADYIADPPPSGLIVRKSVSGGSWRDERGTNWDFAVPWDVHDHDVAIVDAETLAVDYVTGLMNLNMQLAARSDGVLTVIGTEAFNHRRFEPNLTGTFVRSHIAFVQLGTETTRVVRDLNPHLANAYAAGIATLPPDDRALSVADPRAIAWSGDGQTGYVAGQGTNNVIRIDAAGRRTGQIDVGAGPTGLALDVTAGRLYVLSRFDAGISVIDTAGFVEVERIALFDPTPEAIRAGRPFLYDARQTSGLGVTACASCHVDGRMDQLAWDLGVPSDEVKPFDQICDPLLFVNREPNCGDFHPLKGPMMTQTLQGIVGNEPLHWRGDRADLAAFNPAFVNLNGAERELTDAEMAAFEGFLATIVFPPNPFRDFDNSLPEDLNGGNARRGRVAYVHDLIDKGNSSLDVAPILSCNRCHELPTGTTRRIVKGGVLNLPQSMKVPHLRNVYEKFGLSKTSTQSNRGFGFMHDGAVATLEEFFALPPFDFGPGETGAQKMRDVIAFVMAFSTDTHAGVGHQVTLREARELDGPLGETLARMLTLADRGDVGLIVRGRWQGEPRGFAYRGDGMFQSDRSGETVEVATLQAAIAPGAEQTWTLVPLGSETRLGVDADLDGVLDGDPGASP